MMPAENRNIFHRLLQRANTDPEGVLISVEGEIRSNGAFVLETERLASALAQSGVKQGDRIGIILPNSVVWYVVFFAAVRIGAEPVPLDPQIGAWEMERLLGLTEVSWCFVASHYKKNPILESIKLTLPKLPCLKRVVVIGNDFEIPSIHFSKGVQKLIHLEALISSTSPNYPPPVPEVSNASRLMLACTSGSTGAPKIIAVPHLGFLQAQQDMADYLGFSQGDVMLLGMPLYHQGGFGMGLQMVQGGGAVYYQPTFDPAGFLGMIEQAQVTVLQLTPTVAKIILSLPDFDRHDLRSVKTAYFAGEVLPVEVARVFTRKLGMRVVNIVGSTETGTMVVWDSKFADDSDVNVFKPLPFTKLLVMNENRGNAAVGESGTIVIHTDALLLEYYKNEQETKARIFERDGTRWFDTGDIGQLIHVDTVRFLGRKKRVIKRGGNLVYPEEIESFLLTHPDIEAVAIKSEPHDLIGESVTAYIQPRSGCMFTRREMVKFCTGGLSAYKIPDKTVIVDAIPKDIGKVQFKYLKH